MTDRIEVVCDSPKHARKQAPQKIATYRRGDNGEWKVGRGNQTRRLAKRRASLEAAGLNASTIERAMQLALASDPLECKLCGLKLRRPRKVPLLHVLDSLAAQGESRISLKKLIVLVSTANEQ
jgi:hypothetical protein